MKAEERHQLKENDLSSWLQYGLPMFLKQNGSYIILVVALAFLGYQLWHLYQNKQEEYRDTAQFQFTQVPDIIVEADRENAQNIRFNGKAEYITQLRNVIDTYDIPALKAKCYLKLGNIYPQVILFPEAFPTLRLTRSDVLKNAEESFQKAIELDGSDVLVAGQATLGLAGIAEDRQNWDEAKKQYELLTDTNGRFAGTPFLTIATQRIATLEERKKAPPLISMISSIAMRPPTTPTIPGGMPGMFGGPIPNLTGPEHPTTGPAVETGGVAAPFIGPIIPGEAPRPKPETLPTDMFPGPMIAPPATAPANAPN